MITITRHPTGPRLHIAGHRIHHGPTGLLIAAIGLAIAAHDHKDWPWRPKDP